MDGDPRIRAAQEALDRRYLYGSGDYGEIFAELAGLLADASTPPATRAAAAVVSGMTLHFQTIELSPHEREHVDPAAERRLFVQAGEGTAAREVSAAAAFGLGLVEQVLRSDFEAALPHLRSAFELMDRLGRVEHTLLGSEIVRHLGFDALIRCDDAPRAIEQLVTSLAIRRRLDEQGWVSSGHRALALAYRRAGEHDAALHHARLALDVAESLGLRSSHIDGARAEVAAARRAA